MMKRICLLLLSFMLPATMLFTGCTKKENAVSLGSGETTVQVTSINGKEITVTFGNGMENPQNDETPEIPNGDFNDGEFTTGEIAGSLEPSGEGGETPPERPENFEGEEPGTFNPRAQAVGGSSLTAVLTLSDTSVLFLEEDGRESSATLSDISVGTTLKLTLGEKGEITKILIVNLEPGQAPLQENPS